MKTISTLLAALLLAVAFSSCQTAAKKADGCCGTCPADAKKK